MALARLERYTALLATWQAKINLVSTASLQDIWRRHILDAAQLAALIPGSHRRLVDIGSGAGLPGLILAILGFEDVMLIESDGRKCAFLKEAARVTGTAVKIHHGRAETAPRDFPAAVITARALAKYLAGRRRSTSFPPPACKIFGDGTSSTRRSWPPSSRAHIGASLISAAVPGYRV